ncbi:amiloride-sensitive sodium channel subunit alpha-like [Symsagittifera roscoffensis]|uniref:amiloride-sensitive sodium channel subunit alpha-like n=1 Tax=Symsagittifera roscoffensis TaxID=84072 RepID=UPI00307CA9B6
MYMVWRLCCSESSIAGVPNYSNSEGRVLPKFWLVANLLCWSGFIVVLSFLAKQYSGFPTTVAVDIVANNSLLFPSVSICNMNRVSQRKLNGNSYYQALPALQSIVHADFLRLREVQLGTPFYINQSECRDENLFWCLDGQNCISTTDYCDGVEDCDDLSDEDNCSSITPRTNDTFDDLNGSERGLLNIDLYNKVDWRSNPDWFDALNLSRYEDLRDLYDFTLMDRGLVTNTGADKDNFIRSCSFDRSECSSDDFYQFENARYGNCFTFNAPIDEEDNFNESNIRRTGRTGSDFGLKLTLFVDSEDYLGILGHKTGAKVVIHSPSIEPDLTMAVTIQTNGWMIHAWIKVIGGNRPSIIGRDLMPQLGLQLVQQSPGKHIMSVEESSQDALEPEGELDSWQTYFNAADPNVQDMPRPADTNWSVRSDLAYDIKNRTHTRRLTVDQSGNQNDEPSILRSANSNGQPGPSGLLFQRTGNRNLKRKSGVATKPKPKKSKVATKSVLPVPSSEVEKRASQIILPPPTPREVKTRYEQRLAENKQEKTRRRFEDTGSESEDSEDLPIISVKRAKGKRGNQRGQGAVGMIRENVDDGHLENSAEEEASQHASSIGWVNKNPVVHSWDSSSSDGD